MTYKSTNVRALVVAMCAAVAATGMMADNLTLRYDRPANFFEEALVIGNGTIGATVYGGTRTDRISLNDITLWTGGPDTVVTTPDAWRALDDVRALLDKGDYKGADNANKHIQGHYTESYQPLGTLYIDQIGNRDAAISSYSRTLDISKAVANTTFEADGYKVVRDYFASAPDSVIVVKLATSAPGGLDVRLRYDAQLPHSTNASGNEITVDGYAARHSYPSYVGGITDRHLYDPDHGMRFRTIIKVVAPDSKVMTYPSGEIKISGGSEALVFVANATSFNGFDRNPATDGSDYRAAVERRVNRAASKVYSDLRDTHIADYSNYFNRVSLDLGVTDPAIAALPTDVQLKLYTDESQRNPDLEELYFQYGRYLLISCSRTDGVPANLQGLWNEHLLPPWSSNYTSNINLEENYWPAEVTNLSEMHRPLLTFIANLSQTGSATAANYYNVDKGWCLGHNTDIWAMTCPVGLTGGDPSWANWNMGGAWVSTHIMEHYDFTRDIDFLEEYYPYLRGAAEFCLDWLIEKDGVLMTSPGTSPENRYVTTDGYVGATSYGNTADLAMTRECLADAARAAKILGVDKDFQKRVADTLKRIAPYKVGKKGNLQEWYYDWEDQDPRHRHQSHLFGLYPGHHISVDDTPQLASAAARTLQIKGDETTGWSTGWRVNLYSRLRDGEGAYHMYRKLLKYVSPDGYRGEDARRGGGTYPNLLDAHSPFQIDGNFGGCAGVVEMLMQSTPDEIVLLPALPAQWADGDVKGICARGGFVVDMSWRNGKVTALTVKSRAKGKTTLRFNGRSQTLSMRPGETRTIL